MTPKTSDAEYDVVKFHSKQKHAFLKGYLRIWTDHVGKNHGENALTLQFFDLFGGTGICKEEYSGEEWEGSAIRLAECLELYPSKWDCPLYVNSFNPEGEDAQQRQLEVLSERIHSVGLPTDSRPVHIQAQPVETAVLEAADILDPNYPSLWVLDPWRPQQLPWSVIETITALEGEKYERRPELFINLMTYQLCQNIDNAPHIVSTALGMPEDGWRPRVEELQENGLNTREALVQIYGDRLTGIYGKPPWQIDVPGVKGNIVYVLFLCLQHDAAFHSVRKILLPKFKEWKSKKFDPSAATLAANRTADRTAEKAGHRQDRLF